jgi:hypothetical protein
MTASIPAIAQNGVNGSQDVFVPLPSTPIQTPQPFGVQMAADPSLRFAPPPDSPFELGYLALKPHFLYRVLYGDGVPSRPGHDLTTSINSFAPGILMSLGNWSLDYTPTWNLYSNAAFRNVVDENEQFGGLIVLNSSTLKLSQSYVYTAQPLVETGTQTTEQDFSESLNFTHRFSQEIFSESIFDENSRLAIGFPNSNDWSAMDWLHYQFSSQFDTAIGSEFGYISVNEGSNIFYFRPEGQITWSPSKKFSLNVSGGVDRREFLTTHESTLSTPIYSATLQYNPFDWTGISLTAGREVDLSYFVNQSTKNTIWKASLSQRLLEHFFFVATAGEHDSDFISNLTATSAGRNDTTMSYDVQLSWSFLKRGSFTVMYLWTRNNSSVRDYAFSSHQVGGEFSFKY